MADTEEKRNTHQLADKFMLRIHEEGFRKELKVRAARNERTLNGEILYLIKRGLQAEQQREGVAA